MPATDPNFDDTLTGVQKHYDFVLARLNAAPLPTPAERRAIRATAEDLYSRMCSLQNLSLVAVGPDLAAALTQVAKADKELTAGLQEITDTAKLIDSVSGYLAVVDQALDLAKRLA